jgi:hypothetical protein
MICNRCNKEMFGITDDTCAGNKEIEFPDGTVLESVPSDNPYRPGERCRDCNVIPGGKHHGLCCLEMCPRCGGQLISCGCLDDPYEHESPGVESRLIH